MSSVPEMSNPRSDRAPLRNVQNEMLNLQQTTNLMLKQSVHESFSKTKHEDVSEPRTPSNSMKCHVKTIRSPTDACSYAKAVDPNDEHQDVTLKSFLCLEGEVIGEDEPVMSDESVLVKRLVMENIQSAQSDMNEPDETEDTEYNQISEDHVDHPYSAGSNSFSTLYQKQEDSIYELGSVTYKSLMCSGGETQISDSSDESSVTKNQESGVHLQSLSDKTLLENSQPADHYYHSVKNDMSQTEDGSSIYTAESVLGILKSPEVVIVSTTCEPSNSEHLNNYEHTNLSEQHHDLHGRPGEITFKSMNCSGIEIEIADRSKTSETSVLLENYTDDQPQPRLCDISLHDSVITDALIPEHKHVDHLYCHNKENVDLLMEKSPALKMSNILRSSTVSQCLLDNSENTMENLNESPHDTSDKMSGPVVCCKIETEASKWAPSLQLCDHVEALNLGENKMKSSDIEQLSEHVDRLCGDDEEKMSKNGNSVMMEEGIEEHLDHHHQSQTERKDCKENSVSCDQNVFSQDIVSKTSIPSDVSLDLKDEDDHPDIEGMRSKSLCEGFGEAFSVHRDLPSAVAQTDPCTPPPCSLNISLLHDSTAENPASHLWAELTESPLPTPLFSSTHLANTLSCTPVPVHPSQPKVAAAYHQKVVNDPPVLGTGPLQEQLRQMAELLMLASGKVVVSAPAVAKQHNASVGTSPIEMRSACVWSTPIQMRDRSSNTSAAVEILNTTDVSDASTSTDSLLWNFAPGSLEHLSRSELEQRLTTTLVMVEVLSQQLTSARSHHFSEGTSPSGLRDKLIQTDHTELRQNGLYKDLYVTAQERIQSLEHDQESLQKLYNSVQDMRADMATVESSTEEAIVSVKQIGDIIHADQEGLHKQVIQMRCLYERYKDTIQRMAQKMKDMRQRMDETLQEKEAAFSVTQQLRAYYAVQVADLEQSVGSHQELMSALSLTYPSLVEVSKSYVESISATASLLRRKHEDHESLFEELRKTQELVRRLSPVLHQLHQRAVSAMEQSKQHLTMRDRAVEERDLMENELEQMRASLCEASQQITDLNTQQTIMTSEMSVLREQLSQAEEEHSQLQRRSTELSATVTSTLASYTFLEQTLTSEANKLQQAIYDTQQATERADSLEGALESSRKQMEEYEEVLSQREILIKHLHAEAEVHRSQIAHMIQMQTELTSAKEMSEFLQVENELAREQMEESERLLRCHLQGLRERNLECEDLKLALEQLRLEKESLQEELDSTREKARSMLLQQGEQLAQASNDVVLLNQSVSRLNDIIKLSLTGKRSECSDQRLPSHRHLCGSFVDSVMVAMTETQDPETEPAAGSGERKVQHDVIGSESSAFTRIPTTTARIDKEESEISVRDLLCDLGERISDLQTAIDQLRVQRDTEQHTLQQNICGLQEALQSESQRHMLEVSELRQHVDRLQAQVEKDAAVLQQKAQDEKSLRKLCSELEENMEAAHKYKAENCELRREVADLRRLQQQAQVEVHVLREELKQTGVQSAAGSKALDERIKLLREVEKLKASLMETEENRAKVLERAKRHQMVHAMNQSKLERELHLLDDMIETVRQTLSSIPDLVKSCPELQKLVEFLG